MPWWDQRKPISHKWSFLSLVRGISFLGKYQIYQKKAHLSPTTMWSSQKRPCVWIPCHQLVVLWVWKWDQNHRSPLRTNKKLTCQMRLKQEDFLGFGLNILKLPALSSVRFHMSPRCRAKRAGDQKSWPQTLARCGIKVVPGGHASVFQRHWRITTDIQKILDKYNVQSYT